MRKQRRRHLALLQGLPHSQKNRKVKQQRAGPGLAQLSTGRNARAAQQQQRVQRVQEGATPFSALLASLAEAAPAAMHAP